jgi:hypothetical protein
MPGELLLIFLSKGQENIEIINVARHIMLLATLVPEFLFSCCKYLDSRMLLATLGESNEHYKE